jgi:hypothetical protein
MDPLSYGAVILVVEKRRELRRGTTVVVVLENRSCVTKERDAMEEHYASAFVNLLHDDWCSIEEGIAIYVLKHCRDSGGKYEV